jgi:two-component system OmpR family response regulator
MRVLLVDDNAELRDLVTRALSRDGHAVTTAATVAAAREALADNPPEVVVLDLGLPDGSGMDLCRTLRAEGERVPILMLTAQGAVARRVEGLESGADDFLAKPFAVAELRARVRVLGRRGPAALPTTWRQGAVAIDFAARRAVVEGAEVPLTAREWALVEFLSTRGGRMARRGEILDAVWGTDSPQASASLDVLTARVRRKLGATTLRTVRGEGYALGSGE